MRKSCTYFLLLVLPVFLSSLRSQDSTLFYHRIEATAIPMIALLKNGDIKGLEKVTPPKDTWLYSKLLDYRKVLSEENDSIFYGGFIKPATIKGNYGVNFFAFGK